jgi:hypothetical protein
LARCTLASPRAAGGLTFPPDPSSERQSSRPRGRVANACADTAGRDLGRHPW